MHDQDDLQWFTSHASQLKRLLQQVSRYSDQARLHRGEDRYFNLLADRIEQATKQSQELFDRLVTRSVAEAKNRTPSAPGNSSTAANAASENVIVKLALSEIESNSQACEDPPVRNPQGKREMILLVDDDEEVLERTGEMLDFEDYQVVSANDGPEALQIYRQVGDKIALVLLDYFLPVMDGDVVFDELKAINPEVQVVLSSGFGEQAKLGSMLANGLCGFIPKPYTHEKLINQIRLILDA